MSGCLVCHGSARLRLLDFGPQPVSNDFTDVAGTQAVKHHLALSVCRDCGVVQLDRPFPYQDLTPKFAWITYREPEQHLDAMVEKVCRLPGLSSDSVIAGLSNKDRTTIERFQRAGYGNTQVIDPGRDLGATDPNANIETVQGLLDRQTAKALVARTGAIDLLIARHIVEHAQAPSEFIGAIGELLSPGGYAVIEVPDNALSLSLMDYTMVWEEHSLYLTRETLPALLANQELKAVASVSYPYPFENCLVLIARKGEASFAGTDNPALADSASAVSQAQEYAAGFEAWTSRYRQHLSAIGRQAGFALYGAGHLTCAFVNYHGLAECFRFVVDDTPEKRGLFLPGTGLPIVSRERLARSPVATCLLGLAPELEERVIGANRDFTARRGHFASILAASRRSLRNDLSIGIG